MEDKRVYLKVKIKSLAEEAKIIRREERKPHKDMDSCGYSAERIGLWCHRTGIVRQEARHTLLAYGFIRGRKYWEMEASCEFPPNWDRVKKLVEKYGTNWVEGESLRAYQRREEKTLLCFEGWKPGKNLAQKAKHWALSKIV